MEGGEKEYIKLPSGYWWSPLVLSMQNHSLWLARDHLLQLELSMSYTESAKRFYFRDIQALILSKTDHWRLVNTLLGILTPLVWLLSAAVTAPVVKPALLIAGGIFALILLANLLAGPTCVCHLKTAVHEEKLPALRRLRQAREIINRLQPLIEAAQGQVSQEEVAAQFQTVLQQFNPGETVAAGQPLPRTDIIQPYRGPWHRLLYGTLLLVSGVSIANLFLPSVTVTVVFIVMELALMGAAVMSLVKQNETDLKPALKSLTWLAGAYVAINYLVGYIVMMAAIMPSPHASAASQWAGIQALSRLNPQDTPWYRDLLIISAVVSAGLGLWGNLLLGKHWREKQTAEPAVMEAPPQ